MLKKIGVKAKISRDESDIALASKLILPGVGSFDHGIENLRSARYFSTLERQVLINKTPILGVCLGVQLFAERSEEGVLPGLGWIKGSVVKFDSEKVRNASLKIPHMGWAEINLKKKSMLFADMFPDPRFYFVHSYHFLCSNQDDELLTAHYGYEFTAGVESTNIVGVQFHPEKSHKYGMRLYENFVKRY
jgi:glutamine amidotransferase